MPRVCVPDDGMDASSQAADGELPARYPQCAAKPRRAVRGHGIEKAEGR